MSDRLQWMKDVYTKAQNNDFDWKPIYPNNILSNGVVGIFTDMFFELDNKFQYIKFSIQYQPRCDKDGISHPAEGTAFYILHELTINDLDEKFEIPEPSEKFDIENDISFLINNYGRFRYAFSDEETAKCAAAAQLIHMIYPFGYLLSEDEQKEWNLFVGN